jgi:hypothetical protein
MSFIVSVDLGQKQDYSAVVVVERPLWLGGWQYLTQYASEEAKVIQQRWQWANYPEGDDSWILNVVHVQRWVIGTEYPAIVADVNRLMAALQRVPDVETKLIVDATGVGQPVVDMLKARSLYPIALTITGGTTVTKTDQWTVTVPKRDLVFSSVALLESKRLRWAQAIPEIPIMERELRSFEMKYSKAGNELFEAERREHDDLVLALAMATWLTTQGARYALGGVPWLI